MKDFTRFSFLKFHNFSKNNRHEKKHYRAAFITIFFIWAGL